MKIREGERKHEVLQGNPRVPHARGKQEPPQERVFQTDIAVEMEVVCTVIPKAQPEYLIKRPAGDKLQQCHHKSGDEGIDQKRMPGGFLEASKKTGLCISRSSDQTIQQQEGTTVNGAEWQCQKAAVIESAITQQEEKGFSSPSKEGDGHEQYKISGNLL